MKVIERVECGNCVKRMMVKGIYWEWFEQWINNILIYPIKMLKLLCTDKNVMEYLVYQKPIQ